MSTPDYKTVPPAQARTDDWRVYFSHLADRARETNFGLPENQQRVLGLCVLLDAAEERLLLLDSAEVKAAELADKVKGLELTLARYKAREEKAK